MPQVHTQSLCTAHTEQWDSDRGALNSGNQTESVIIN